MKDFWCGRTKSKLTSWTATKIRRCTCTRFGYQIWANFHARNPDSLKIIADTFHCPQFSMCCGLKTCGMSPWLNSGKKQQTKKHPKICGFDQCASLIWPENVLVYTGGQLRQDYKDLLRSQTQSFKQAVCLKMSNTLLAKCAFITQWIISWFVQVNQSSL